MLPPPVMPTGLPAKSMLAMPIPFPNAASYDSPVGSIPSSPSVETVNPNNPAKARRLSFLSYAGTSTSLVRPAASAEKADIAEPHRRH